MRRLFFLMLFLSLGVSPVFAKMAKPPPGAIRKPANKLEKHFDLDENGYVTRHELELLRTHRHFKYPLAKTTLQKAYDLNFTGMLEPHEESQIARDKHSPRRKKMIADYKDKHPRKSKRKPGSIPVPNEYLPMFLTGGIPGL